MNLFVRRLKAEEEERRLQAEAEEDAINQLENALKVSGKRNMVLGATACFQVFLIAIPRDVTRNNLPHKNKTVECIVPN